MIDLMFTFGTEYILVAINGNDVKIGNTKFGAQMANIEGLKLDKSGVIKEFPDLVDNENWRVEAVKRFKEKIKSFATESEIEMYIREDLKKFGYKPYYRQVHGHRKESIK